MNRVTKMEIIAAINMAVDQKLLEGIAVSFFSNKPLNGYKIIMKGENLCKYSAPLGALDNTVTEKNILQLYLMKMKHMFNYLWYKF